MTTALAIFVKTPGLSPIKTRLAAGIGRQRAEQFHRLAAQAVAAVARAAMPAVEAHWAVAEAEALQHPAWTGLPTLWQGDGGLGARLDTVCAALQARHGRVLLVGADCPQLTITLVRDALRALDDPRTPLALGRADDGGFWLFGARIAIPGEVWRTTSYSSASTADQLSAALRPLGALASLPTLTDIDHARDLAALGAALDALPDPLPEQTALRTWLRTLPTPAQDMAVPA